MRAGPETDFFGRSAARRAVLLHFFARPGVEGHVREVARRLGRPPAVVGRELDRLEHAGVLISQRVGRNRVYKINVASPIADDVRRLVQKTIGIEAILEEAIGRVPGVEEAFLFGSYARETDRATSDIDLFAIGSVDQEVLSERLHQVEQTLGRDVNVVTYRRDELRDLERSGDAFIRDVLGGPRVTLIPSRGTE